MQLIASPVQLRGSPVQLCDCLVQLRDCPLQQRSLVMVMVMVMQWTAAMQQHLPTAQQQPEWLIVVGVSLVVQACLHYHHLQSLLKISIRVAGYAILVLLVVIGL
jgi:hypothetical protein